MFRKLLPTNPAVREKLRHNTVQPKGPQMTIQQGKKGVDLCAVRRKQEYRHTFIMINNQRLSTTQIVSQTEYCLCKLLRLFQNAYCGGSWV